MSGGVPLAEAFVRIRAEDSQFRRDVERSTDGLGTAAGRKFGTEFSRDSKTGLQQSKAGLTSESEKIGSDSGTAAGRKFGPSFGAMVGTALAALGAVNFFGDALGEAREAQKVSALTAQVIQTMGGAAKISAGQVAELAGAISAKTGIDDEAIQSGSNLLLTFTNIRNEVGAGNDIFNQASQAVVDMGAALGSSPKEAAIQLGKALNDPVKGITALGRAGVSFTEDQKKAIKAMVESGDTMGAQKIILKELNKEFGGAAEAQATAGDKASVAMGNLKETIGTALLPVVDSLASTFTDTVAPALTDFVGKVQEAGTWANEHKGLLLGLAAVIGTVTALTYAHTAAMTIQAAGGFIAWVTQVTGLTRVWAAVQWLMNAAMSANPIGIVVIAIAALVAAIVYAWNNSETFRSIVIGAWEAVKNAVVAVVDWFKTAVPAAFEWVKNAFLTYTPLGFVISHWSQIRDFIGSAVDRVKSIISWFGGLPGMFAGWFGSVVSSVSTKIGEVVDYVKGLPGRIVTGLGNVGSLLADKGRDLIEGFIGGIRDMAGRLASFVRQFIVDHIPGPVRDALGISSPSRVMREIGRWIPPGLVEGIDDASGVVGPAVSKMLTFGSLTVPALQVPRFAGPGAPGAAGDPLAGRSLYLVLEDGRQLSAYVDDRAGAVVSASAREVAWA